MDAMDQSRYAKLERAILDEARAMYDRNASVGEFSGRIFGPDGLLRQMWSNDDERHELVKSTLFKRLQDQLHELGAREVEQFERDIAASPDTDAVAVALPRKLHSALRDEARAMGLSISELIRRKLGGEVGVSSEGSRDDKRKPEAA